MIESMLRSGAPIRTVAGRFSLSKSAIDRHLKHDQYAQTRKDTAQIARIDAEISKLIRAQNRAKRKRDNSAVIAVARELRHWYGLRAKVEAVSIANQPKAHEELPRSEATALAQSLIESELASGSSDVRAWLCELTDRIRAATDANTQPESPDG